jgi:PAS domain S-box-containing protein
VPVTESHQPGAIDALRALAFETIGDAVLVMELDGRVIDLNPAAERLFGYLRDEVLGQTPAIFREAATGERQAAAIWDSIARSGTWAGEYVFRRKDGQVGTVDVHVVTRFDAQGRPVGMVGVGRDVTERRRVERALSASEERYRLVSRATNDLVYDWDMVAGTLSWNDALTTAFRHPAHTVREDLAWWEEQVHPDDRARVLASLTGAMQAGGETWGGEYRFRRGTGDYAFVLDRGRFQRDASGRPVRMVGVMVDLTDRRQLEEQLRQAQKMEAVGQLAGGMAHDFNNIMTAVQLHAEFLLEALHPSDPRRRDAEEVARAVSRAAGLTRQLLAFSRKQLLSPRFLDLNETVRETVKMLRRLIGEHIAISTSLAPDLWRVHADAGQLEQVLLNLALNARDAMPQGGRLAIATENLVIGDERSACMKALAPGDYVRLSVKDTGIGMDAATRARVFEPFFTTKRVGEGTGLGLAMVYGIVKQSGGSIWVESTPGEGATFHICLPRAQDDVATRDTGPALVAAARGAETVLLVEDEEAVRGLARRVLQRQGYRVLEARNGREALAVADAHEGEIHLLLTDAVMPELGGLELVDVLRARRPGLRVLVVSGYTSDDAERRGGSAAGIAFLQKPFTMHQLASVVRAVIDADA